MIIWFIYSAIDTFCKNFVITYFKCWHNQYSFPFNHAPNQKEFVKITKHGLTTESNFSINTNLNWRRKENEKIKNPDDVLFWC